MMRDYLKRDIGVELKDINDLIFRARGKEGSAWMKVNGTDERPNGGRCRGF